MSLPGLIGVTGVRGLGRRGSASAPAPYAPTEAETIALVDGETDWSEATLQAVDAFFSSSRALLGSDYAVGLIVGPDLSRGIRAVDVNAGVPTALATTNVGPFTTADYAETGPLGGLKGNRTTKWLDTNRTPAQLGMASTAGFAFFYGNKEQMIAVNGVMIGAGVGGGGDINVARFTSDWALRPLAATRVNATNDTPLAWFGFSRINGSQIVRMQDVLTDTVASTGQTPSSSMVRIFARDTPFELPSNERIKFWAVGGRAMPAADAQQLRLNVITLQTALGRATA